MSIGQDHLQHQIDTLEAELSLVSHKGSFVRQLASCSLDLFPAPQLKQLKAP
jgi:hypothetical protein